MMMHEFQTGSLLIRYLLGEASPEECGELEAKYLSDGDFFEELVAAENDLIDAYASGQLSAPDRARFEEYFLVTSERRRRVEFAKALRSHVAAETGKRQREKTGVLAFPPAAWHRWLPTAWFFVLLIFAASMTWSILKTTQNFYLQAEIAKLQREIADLQGKQRALQLQIEAFRAKELTGGNEQGKVKTPTVAVLTLDAGISRSSGAAHSVVISSATRSVRLRLRVERGYSKLNATVETANGTRVWQKQNLPVYTGHNAEVSLILPAKMLANGDYIVNLTANPNEKQAIVSSYAFRVVGR
jgi:anti-sigma factor RsiW